MRSSFLWNAIENFSRMGVQFVIGVILARLLNVYDYGILGIISVFIAISQTLIDAGFSNALLRKKECTSTDYSTVFFTNVAISVLVFIILFLFAPLVSSFYDSPILCPVLRCMGASIIIQSLYTVHKVKLTKELQFKQLAFIAFVSSAVSGILAIILAYKGCGVWSLVFQSICGIVLSGLLIAYKAHWMPSLAFSKQSFKSLFDFGSKLLASNLIFTFFNNLYNLVIGKCLTPQVLGYYSRADGYSRLMPVNIGTILQNIMLPILSKLQDDDEALRNLFVKFTKITSFFIFPLSLFLCVLAKPVILLMISEKWADTIPILQILCIAYMFDHISSLCSNFLMVKGKSDRILIISSSSKVLLVLLLVASFHFGVIVVAWSKFVYSIFVVLLSTFYLNKTLSVSLGIIMKSITPMLLITIASAFIIYILSSMLPTSWPSLILCLIASIVIYTLLSSIFLKEELQMVKSLRR